jgi:hypothetical protein
MTSLTRYIVLIIAGILAIYLLNRAKLLPDLRNVFRSKPVMVENTPVLIKEIREMTQLISVTSYDEVVVDSAKSSSMDIVKALTGVSTPLSPPMDRIVIVAKGSVQAGTNLRFLTESNIYVEGDSVAVQLPEAEILEVIVNPSGFSTFTETGIWSPDAVNLVKTKAKKVMEQRAVGKNILGIAEQRARLLMENFLRAAGFKKVTIL